MAIMMTMVMMIEEEEGQIMITTVTKYHHCLLLLTCTPLSAAILHLLSSSIGDDILRPEQGEGLRILLELLLLLPVPIQGLVLLLVVATDASEPRPSSHYNYC